MPARTATEGVHPDLPVTPMLDMSFQLMAFFLFTFRPAAAEGHIPTALPADGVGFVNPDVPLDPPTTFVVAVTAGPNGGIGGMTIRDKDGPPAADPIGADLGRYRAELAARRAALRGRPARLTLEIGDGVRHESVVRLLASAPRPGSRGSPPSRSAGGRPGERRGVSPPVRCVKRPRESNRL